MDRVGDRAPPQTLAAHAWHARSVQGGGQMFSSRKCPPTCVSTVPTAEIASTANAGKAEAALSCTLPNPVIIGGRRDLVRTKASTPRPIKTTSSERALHATRLAQSAVRDSSRTTAVQRPLENPVVCDDSPHGFSTRPWVAASSGCTPLWVPGRSACPDQAAGGAVPETTHHHPAHPQSANVRDATTSVPRVRRSGNSRRRDLVTERATRS